MSIVTRENEAPSIEKLAAQRQIYSSAKNLFYLQMSISVFLMVFLSFAQLLYPKQNLTLIIATLSILAVITDNLLDNFISKEKESASKVQELFDTYVLNIGWNSILCGEKPEYSFIYSAYRKQKKNKGLTKFADWYDAEVDSIPEMAGKIICQKSNCNYDAAIRRKYNRVFYQLQ
jgi:hypothetical protein